MKLPETPSITQRRTWLNLIAFAVVAVFGGILIWLGSGDPTPTITLEGDGCSKAEGGVCELVSGEARELLRDCSQEAESGASCSGSAFEIGNNSSEGQYVLLKSEFPFQVVTVYQVDQNTLEYSEVATHFYTPVEESCEDNRDSYGAECFSYPVSDAQREDIWQSNQSYQQAIDQYGR